MLRLRCTSPPSTSPSRLAQHPTVPTTPSLPTRLAKESDLHRLLQEWHRLPTLERLLTLSPREHKLYTLYRSQSRPLLCKPLYLQYHPSLLQSYQEDSAEA